MHGLAVRNGGNDGDDDADGDGGEGGGGGGVRRRRTLALLSMVNGQLAVFNCTGGKMEEDGVITASEDIRGCPSPPPPPSVVSLNCAGVARGPNQMCCDGQWLLFGGSKRDLVLYDLEGRREVRRLHNRNRCVSWQ